MKTSNQAMLASGALLLASLSAPAIAHADIGVSIGLGVPAPVYAAPAPVYYAPPPPPVYYAPAPRVVYRPAYVAPAPVYYAPRVVYPRPYYRPSLSIEANIGRGYYY